jgi:hypothetical protein
VSTAPLTHVLRASVDGAEAGGDDLVLIGSAPFAGVVSAVAYAPEAAMTGAAVNHRRLRLVNRGQSGSGTAVVAELLFSSGAVTAAAGDARALTLSGTGANLVVAAGDVLAWESTPIGTGMTDPGGLVEVSITRTGGQ